MNTMTLEPCPFCGMAVEYVTRPVSYGSEFWYVYHPEHPSGDCILEDRKFSSARGWNHRAQLTAHARTVEKVREVISILRADGAPFYCADIADKLVSAIGDKP
jgi:tRNA(Arg) A34 adenosine deaminase TadA